MQVFLIVNNVGKKINDDVNEQNLLIKEYDKKGFFLDPSSCECEWDKLCDVGEYLDYQNCKRRKRLVDKLVEECTENFEGEKITGITLFEHKSKCKSSCSIHVVLNAIVFAIYIGIGTYFVYNKYMNHSKKKPLLNMIKSTKHQIISINGKYQKNKH